MKQFIEVNFKTGSDLVLELCNIEKLEYMRVNGTKICETDAVWNDTLMEIDTRENS